MKVVLNFKIYKLLQWLVWSIRDFFRQVANRLLTAYALITLVLAPVGNSTHYVKYGTAGCLGAVIQPELWSGYRTVRGCICYKTSVS